MKSSGGLIVLVILMTSGTWTYHVEEVIGQEGHSVIFNSGERSEVTWKFGNTKDQTDQMWFSSMFGTGRYGDGIKERITIGNGYKSLTIKNVQKTDFGFFSCETKNKKTVYRLYKATVVSYPDRILLASENLELKCDVELAERKERLTYQWLSPSNKKMQTSNTLTVPSVTGEHHGLWTCVVTLEGRSANITLTVTVGDLFQPKEIIYTSSSSPFFTIPCATTVELSKLSKQGLQEGHWSFQPFGGKEDPQKIVSLSVGSQVKWKEQQDSKMVNWTITKEDLKTNLDIHKNKVSGEDAGLYTCSLDFKNSITIKKTVRVEVLRVFSSHGPPVNEGQAINLTCTLGHPLAKDLHVQWTAPSKSPISKLLRSPHPPVLSIPDPTMEDKGKWKCELKNNGTTFMSAELMLNIVKVPVNVWLLLSICGAAITSCLLIFLTVMFIRKCRQRAMFRRRQKKIKYCCCKHPQPKGFYKP